MARPRGSRQELQRKAILATGGGKAIGYVRVSTREQGENGHSLEGQATRLREVAAREGLELIEVVAEVASGAKADREALAEVQRRVLAGEAQAIVFPKVDRLGRSMVHLLKVVAWAQENGVDLLAADEGWQVRDGQQVDKMLPFRLAMAQVELERIRERTRDGLRAARAKGVQLGHKPENTALEAAAVELRRQGLTLQAIADRFNAEGHTTARGADHTAMTVYRMIERADPAANPEGGHRGKVVAVAA